MSFEWPIIIHGDAEAAIIALINTAPEIIGFSGGAPRVSSDMIEYQKGDRWIMVSLEGGTKVWPRIWKPRVDINVFGKTRTTTHNLAQVAQAVIIQGMNQAFPEYGIKLTDAKVETDLFRAPDKETGSSRYVFAMRLTCVPI